VPLELVERVEERSDGSQTSMRRSRRSM